MKNKTYTGFNRILKSTALQTLFDRAEDGSIKEFIDDWKWIFGYSKKYLQKYTDAYIKAIKSGRIDVITHLNYGVQTDVKQVAQAAKDYGVIIELNGKRISMTDEEVMEIVNIGPQLIVNSDAHSKERVGDFSVPMSLVDRLGIDKKLIVNWEDLPKFKKHKK